MNPSDMEEAQREEERRAFVDATFRQHEQQLLENRFLVESKPYPVLTALDVFKMANPAQCPLCLWHSMHTPCGVPFSLFNDCMNRNMVRKRYQSNLRATAASATASGGAGEEGQQHREEEEEEGDKECSEAFEKSFYPCFVRKALQQPYYIIRGELVMGGDQKKAMRTWMEMQRAQNVKRYEEKHGQLRTLVGLNITRMAAESRQWWKMHDGSGAEEQEWSASPSV